MSYPHFAPRLALILTVIAAAILSRFLPHPPNFTALNAVCLFGAYMFGSLRLALLTLFSTLFLSDWVIGFYPTLFSVYLSFGLVTLMGYWLSSKFSVRGVALSAPLASLLFFLVTNFSSWLSNPVYSKDLFGLGLSYMAGLPFLAFQLTGDLFYTALLLGLFVKVEQRHPFSKSVVDLSAP